MLSAAPADPCVSVVIATYHCDEYLRLAIASVLAQTVGDYEVLVADDGGQAATQAVVEGFRDPRLIYYRNPERLGPAVNHREAIRRARGEFVAILNHDDLWKPTYLARMLEKMDDPEVVAAFCDHDVIAPDGKFLPERSAEYSRLTGRSQLAEGLYHPFYEQAMTFKLAPARAVLMRRSALDPDALPVEAGPSYDFWISYLLARTGGGAYYVPEMLTSWRDTPTSISRERTRSDWPAGGAACWERIAADPHFVPFHRTARNLAATYYATAALAALRGRRRAEARMYARRAAAWKFHSPRVATILLLTLLPAACQKLVLGIQDFVLRVPSDHATQAA